MTPTILDRISTIPGFRALFETAQYRDLPKNQIVIKDGEVPEHLYLLLSGRICVRHAGTQGQELLLGYFYPGDFFGEMGLFPDVPFRSALVSTVTASTALKIPYRAFIDMTRDHPELWLALAGQLAQRLRSANHRLAEMPAMHASDRVWLAIQDMANHMLPTTAAGKVIHITRKDLGRLAGCSRELAGMIVTDLAKAGRLRLRGRAIIVPSPEAIDPA